MRPVVIGNPDDVAGFALAGVEGVVCKSREEADRAIALAEENVLLVVSAEFAREGEPRRAIVVLPGRK